MPLKKKYTGGQLGSKEPTAGQLRSAPRKRASQLKRRQREWFKAAALKISVDELRHLEALEAQELRQPVRRQPVEREQRAYTLWG